MLYVHRYLQAKLRPVGQEGASNIGICLAFPCQLSYASLLKKTANPT